jgi:hypothetical protein
MKIYVTRNFNVVKVCGKYPDEVDDAYIFLSKLSRQDGVQYGG